MNEIKVVCALILKDEKVLIARRSEGDSSVYGMWEFPGGKLEKGEDPFKAIEREIKEELNITVKATDFITNTICTYPNKIVDLNLYKCEIIDGVISLRAHFQYKFVKISELLDYNLCPADHDIALYLLKNNI